jgi:hypothetical protein
MMDIFYFFYFSISPLTKESSQTFQTWVEIRQLQALHDSPSAFPAQREAVAL